jgi:hypothetical protein
MMLRSMLAALVALLVGSVATATARAQDLSAHCASVRNGDRVKPIPEELVPAARRALGLGSAESDASLQASAVYRCMSGKVWLCNQGANLTCAKGDISRVSKGATAWCKDHPGAGIVPMVATGHATIHTWTCVGSAARIKQSEKLDARGSICNQWARMEK